MAGPISHSRRGSHGDFGLQSVSHAPRGHASCPHLFGAAFQISAVYHSPGLLYVNIYGGRCHVLVHRASISKVARTYLSWHETGNWNSVGGLPMTAQLLFIELLFVEPRFVCC